PIERIVDIQRQEIAEETSTGFSGVRFLAKQPKIELQTQHTVRQLYRIGERKVAVIALDEDGAIRVSPFAGIQYRRARFPGDKAGAAIVLPAIQPCLEASIDHRHRLDGACRTHRSNSRSLHQAPA